MIEYFRHEAMNQATVISGFCEIIGNLCTQPGVSVEDCFLLQLEKIRKLVVNFHDTLMVFRDECTLEDGAEGILLEIDPAGDFTRFLSPGCAVHFTVLSEIAEVLNSTARLIDGNSIENSKIADRYKFIVESTGKLHELFLYPIAFLQETIKTNRESP